MAQSNVVYANQPPQYQQPVYISGDGHYVTGQQQQPQTNQQVIYVTQQPQQFQATTGTNGYPVSGRQNPQVVVESIIIHTI